MGLGNADLKAKILCIPGKFCLIAVAVLQLLAAMVIIGLTIALYCEMNKNNYMFLFAAPSGFALISAVGAVVFMFVRKQLLALICVIWPIITIVVTAIICLVATTIVSVKGTTVTAEDWKGETIVLQDFTLLFVTVLAGWLLVPLAIFCIVVLCCIGLCKKEGGDVGVGSGASGNTKPNSKTKTKPAATAAATKKTNNRSGHLY